MYIFTKSPLEGVQTTLKCVYEDVVKMENGGFYADCQVSSQNKNVNKQNWDKLWEISQK